MFDDCTCHLESDWQSFTTLDISIWGSLGGEEVWIEGLQEQPVYSETAGLEFFYLADKTPTCSHNHSPNAKKLYPTYIPFFFKSHFICNLY
jgi:hypothetical protein